MNQAAERVESLKVGLTGAITATIAFVILRGSFTWMLLSEAAFSLWIDHWISLATLLQISIVALSGFLFGVTYRYVVRNDTNSHLNSGAVLAFGLVRGGAQLNPSTATDTLALSGIQIMESILIFAITAIVIDRLMQQGWIKRFLA